MSATDLVIYEVMGGLATLTLNRADKKNAFNDDMMQAFGEAIAKANSNKAVRSVLLKADGDIFCSGLDLAGANYEDPAHTLETVWKPVILSIAQSPKIFVAAINGPAIGFGAAVALACDICVMSDSAFFQFPFVSFGWVPDCGLTWLLTQQIGPKKTLQYLTTGERITADKALSLGLVNQLETADALLAACSKMAGIIAMQAPLALTAVKANVAAATTQPMADVMSLEAKVQGQLFASNDAVEAMKAFMQKRAPVFTGS